MESIYAVPYHILECPNLKLKRPSWARMPSAMVVFAVVLASYFLVTGGRHVGRCLCCSFKVATFSAP